MESFIIDIINPKAFPVLKGLADSSLIRISENFHLHHTEEEWDYLTNAQRRDF